MIKMFKKFGPEIWYLVPGVGAGFYLNWDSPLTGQDLKTVLPLMKYELKGLTLFWCSTMCSINTFFYQIDQ